MTSQGWTPGQYLGALDAPHAEFHTAANASHIRVSIKDDNLGLGAKIGSGVGHGECTGLDVFQDLLGRLNGRDEDEIAKERASQEALKRAIYTERKWGSVRFVPGGVLIGDKIQDLIEGEKERLKKLAGGLLGSDSVSSSQEEKIAEVGTKKLKKKRKRDEEAAKPEIVAIKVKKSKKSKKKRKPETNMENFAQVPNVETEETIDQPETKKRKKEKKDKTKSKAIEDTPKKSKKKSKRDKSKSSTDDMSKLSAKESTPIGTPSNDRSTPMMQGRHAVRARNIAQKRLASMDIASLNQIFMIKSKT
ncbi:hypothetical protein B7494_g2911 [Chlorociboria aeruginascens]|nr:hypothetical protein B7494_g2911 [Chlorociboria aeruginascens]